MSGPRARSQETRAIYRLADAAYASSSCSASGECCQLGVTGRQPWLYRSEWELVLEALRRDGRPLPPDRPDGACPLLDASGRRCSLYADRPFGCRTFFCARRVGPARQPIEAVDALLRRLDAVNRELDADPSLAEPKPLLDWVRGSRAAPPRPL